MKEKVKAYMQKWEMLSPGDRVILGLSGGPDSVCLFLLLKELSCDMGFEMVAVHVNHGLRGEEADHDEAYVQALCQDSGVSLERQKVDVGRVARQRKLSTEEAGRLVRRQIFEEVMEKYQADKIALAHHQDDNAETFLLHAARGSRLKGLGGIAPVKGRYIRPLLCVERREIEEYLREKGADYCMDASNGEDIYLRNRIRRHVLPYLTRQINPQTVRHLNGAMEQLREIQGFMERQTACAVKRCVVWEKGEALVKEEFLEREDPLLRDMVLYDTLAKVCGREKDLEEKHVTMLRGLLERQTGRALDLPYKVQALRTYEGLCIRPFGQEKKEEDVEMVLPVKEKPEGSVLVGQVQISWKVFSRESGLGKLPKKTYTKWFDYDIIDQGVRVRTRRPGDRLAVDSQGSTQKLKAYFINEKIPASRRDEILLLAEGSHILWVTGYRQSKAYQVTDRTSTIVEIRIDGGTEYGDD